MNIIQMIERVAFHCDRAKSARFLDSDYIQAINLAIVDIFRDRTENEKMIKPYSLESNNQIMMELYTLINEVTITPVGNTIPYPSNYRFFGYLFVTVDGLSDYCRFAPMEMKGTILKDPFKKPKTIQGDTKFYYEETNGAFNILHNGNTLQSADFKYLAYPQTVTIGTPQDKIMAGTALNTMTLYIVYDDIMYAGVYRPAGTVFMTGLFTSFTGGSVILLSRTQDCDMPIEIHDEICKRAADNLLIKTDDFQKEEFINRNINQD